jgi:hypothetical protein
MARYYVINQSTGDVAIDITSTLGHGYHVVVPRSQALDILPFAGSIDACHNIPGLYDMIVKGYIRVEEER